VPNTLAHLGVQTVASRAMIRGADLRWVFVGCVIPDLPWILNRVLAVAMPDIDVFVIRPYWIAQASLVGSLWLCGALALVSSRPARTFGLLAGNAAGHLVLDALQTKWGNGVHLFAPFSWHTWNVGWFWPESTTTWILTGLGAAVLIFSVFNLRSFAASAFRPTRSKLVLSCALLFLYAVYPLAVHEAVMTADAHSLETLQNPALRPGRRAEFDRVWLEVEGETGRLHVLGGEVLRATGNLTTPGSVSARGRFVGPDQIHLEDVHPHGSFPRALASYLGLGGIVASLAIGRLRSRPTAERRR
jgi:hypothetical protein